MNVYLVIRCEANDIDAPYETTVKAFVNEEQARQIDNDIKEILHACDLTYYSVPGNQKSIKLISQAIINK